MKRLRAEGRLRTTCFFSGVSWAFADTVPMSSTIWAKFEELGSTFEVSFVIYMAISDNIHCHTHVILIFDKILFIHCVELVVCVFDCNYCITRL